MICTPEALAANATAGGFTKLSEKQLWSLEGYLDCQITNRTGGNPTPPPWTPNTPGTLFEWLKADAIGQSTGTAVADWPHSAGVDATASGTAQPTFVTNQQNGLPIVRFNGTANVMAVSPVTSTTQPMTVAIAFKWQGATNGSGNIFYGGNPTVAFEFEAGSLSAGNFYYAAGSIATVSAIDNNFHILFMILNGASSFYGLDGAALVSCNPGTGVNPTTSFSLGARNSGSASVFGQVDIGEVIVWTGAGSSYYSQAYQYLNNRWQ